MALIPPISRFFMLVNGYSIYGYLSNIGIRMKKKGDRWMHEVTLM